MLNKRESIVAFAAVCISALTVVVVLQVTGKGDVPSMTPHEVAVPGVKGQDSEEGEYVFGQGSRSTKALSDRSSNNDSISLQVEPQIISGSEIENRSEKTETAFEEASQSPTVEFGIRRSREEMVALIKENLIAQGQFERLEEYEAREARRVERNAEVENRRELRKIIIDERRELGQWKRDVDDPEMRREIAKMIQLNRDEMRNLIKGSPDLTSGRE